MFKAGILKRMIIRFIKETGLIRSKISIEPNTSLILVRTKLIIKLIIKIFFS